MAIRTKVNTEITRMIMLRETTASVRPRTGDCDCGILDEVVDGLDQVVDTDNQNQNQNQGQTMMIQMISLFRASEESFLFSL